MPNSRLLCCALFKCCVPLTRIGCFVLQAQCLAHGSFYMVKIAAGCPVLWPGPFGVTRLMYINAAMAQSRFER